MEPLVKVGARLRSVVCDTEVIVIKVGDAQVHLECGGTPMVEASSAAPGISGSLDPGMSAGTQVGKRYGDPALDLEVLCVRPGAGTLAVSGAALSAVSARSLPSAD